MLVIGRRVGECFKIDVNGVMVWVHVLNIDGTKVRLGIDGTKVRLGIDGPREAVVTREELLPPGQQFGFLPKPDDV